MQKTVAGSTTGYLYDGANIVQEQGAGASNLVTGFGYDQFYARTDGSGTQVPLSDSLQSTVGMTDGAGGFAAQYTYEPFGATTVVGSGGGSQQFTGRENDGTGLMYYRARYYAPGLGRFVSEDPLGFGGGDVNLYGYVGSDPVSRVDPTGEFFATLGRFAATATMGAATGAAVDLLSQLIEMGVGARDDISSQSLFISALMGAVGALLGTLSLFNPFRGSGLLEWSHTLPARWAGQRYGRFMPEWLVNSGLMGNHVPAIFHSISDSFRHVAGGRPFLLPIPLRAFVRLPFWFTSALTGGALGGVVCDWMEWGNDE